MTPKEFIEKWRDNPLKERASYQLHFIDLCALVGVPHPSPSSHETYCFERGATRTGAGQGWADVWKKSFFGFEYKAARRNLGEALKQLMTYALALDNPPLLVVCDTSLIEIHTHFTNAPSEVHTILLEDIGEPANLEKLRWLFTDPDKFHPKRTIAQITEEAAGKFADLAQSLNARGHDPQTVAAMTRRCEASGAGMAASHPLPQAAGSASNVSRDVAHFLNQCLFCLFAEDAGLLPAKMFERLLDKSQTDPAKLSTRLEALFASMQKGGDFGADDIAWFNGGLFETVEMLPLIASEITTLHAASKLDWSGIEPSIFGTLFERGLDPKKRSQLGAHYTDQQSIMRIVNPVITEPLAAEWDAIKQKIAELHTKFALVGKKRDTPNEAMKEGYRLFHGYLERIKNFRVLDPACGSGNFLYLALRALKDLEHKVNLEAEQLGLHRQVSIEVSPANVLGIELNPYAAELARVTVWIGEIQWMLKNGYPIRKNPILQPLDHIENRDAVLQTPPTPLLQRGELMRRTERSYLPPFEKGGELARGPRGISEAEWPAVDAIIGNPPFLGGSKMRSELGDDYTEALRKCYADRVPGGADLVTYWFEKARAQIAAGKCQRAGLVSTNSIRGGANQEVLARICASSKIFNAWSDEEWINEGAAVRVSLVCFGNVECVALDGQPVETIHADLTSGGGLNLTLAKPLKENAGVSFQGSQKIGAFDIEGELAREWLNLPNPNGRPNSDVVKPSWNGMDVTRRPRDGWIIDFGTSMSEADAALYEAPFEYVTQYVKSEREKNNREAYRKYWWRHGEPRIAMRAALKDLPRYIATPHVSKHRVFIWPDASVLPDKMLIVIARSDDAAFGILHSRFHELWALSMCTWMGVGNDPRYTPTTTFETFPFPEGLTPKDTAPPLPSPLPRGEREPAPSPLTGEGWGEGGEAIAQAAQHLNQLRENWLNPPEWTD